MSCSVSQDIPWPPVFRVMFLVPVLPLMIFLGWACTRVAGGKLTVAAKTQWWMLAAAVTSRRPHPGLAFGRSLGGDSSHELRLLGDFLRRSGPIRRWRKGGSYRRAGHGDGIWESVCSPSAPACRKLQDRKRRGAQTGGSYTIAGYDFRFVDAVDVRGRTSDAVQALVEVTAHRPVAILRPEKPPLLVRRPTTARPDFGQWSDLFVAMGNSLGEVRGACAFNISRWSATSGWAPW